MKFIENDKFYLYMFIRSNEQESLKNVIKKDLLQMGTSLPINDINSFSKFNDDLKDTNVLVPKVVSVACYSFCEVYLFMESNFIAFMKKITIK